MGKKNLLIVCHACFARWDDKGWWNSLKSLFGLSEGYCPASFALDRFDEAEEVASKSVWVRLFEGLAFFVHTV